MMISRLLQAFYEKSPNLIEPQNSSSSITERHTQDTHGQGKVCEGILREISQIALG